MSNFVCKKPIPLNGRKFSHGEIIPGEYILPERVLALVRSGYIAEIEGGLLDIAAEATTPIDIIQWLTIPITANESHLELIMNPKDVIFVLTLLQMNVETATKEIETIVNEDLLILLNATDSRKGIQAATKERGVKLQGSIAKSSLL